MDYTPDDRVKMVSEDAELLAEVRTAKNLSHELRQKIGRAMKYTPVEITGRYVIERIKEVYDDLRRQPGVPKGD